MSETVYPLLPMNSSPHQLLVQRQETFFVDKLSLVADNKIIFQWNVSFLNLKGKLNFTFAGMPMEIHWHWGWSGQPISFNVYANGTTIAKYVEQNPHGVMEASNRYMMDKLGLPTANRVANPHAKSWSFTMIGLSIGMAIMGYNLAQGFFNRPFNFGNFLINTAVFIAGFTLVGYLIDFARLQWYRFRNKS